MKQLKTYAAQHGFDYSNMLVDFLSSSKKEQKEFLAQIGMQEETEPDILQQITEALSQGAEPEAIVQTLVQEGIAEEEEAVGLIQQAMQGQMQVGGIPVNPNGYYELDPYEDPEALIPSGRITMKDIPYEIDAYDAQTGQYLERMQPDEEYDFDTDMVLEKPVIAQKGFVKKVDKNYVYLTNGTKLTQKQFKEDYLDRVEYLNKNKYNTEERRNVVKAVQEYRTFTQPTNSTFQSPVFPERRKAFGVWDNGFNTGKVNCTLQPISTVYDSFDADKPPFTTKQPFGTNPVVKAPKPTTKNPKLAPPKEGTYDWKQTVEYVPEGDKVETKPVDFIKGRPITNLPIDKYRTDLKGLPTVLNSRLSTEIDTPKVETSPQEKQRFKFNGSNIARNLMLSSRVAAANQPVALPFRQHVSLNAEELPELDVSPVVQELSNRFKQASRNINANSTTGQVLAANFYGKTLDEIVKVTSNAAQQNQQIKAKNRFGLLAAANKEQAMNQAFDAKAYEEMLANHASADNIKMQASNDVLDAMYADKQQNAMFDALQIMHPELEEETDWKARLKGQRIFSRNKEFNKIYTKPLETKTEDKK